MEHQVTRATLLDLAITIMDGIFIFKVPASNIPNIPTSIFYGLFYFELLTTGSGRLFSSECKSRASKLYHQLVALEGTIKQLQKQVTKRSKSFL